MAEDSAVEGPLGPHRPRSCCRRQPGREGSWFSSLGTSPKVDTSTALAEIAARPRRLASLERRRTTAEDLGDDGIMRGAWRRALLADTSAFEQQRHSDAAAGLLSALGANGALFMTEIVALELLYCARSSDDYDAP